MSLLLQTSNGLSHNINITLREAGEREEGEKKKRKKSTNWDEGQLGVGGERGERGKTLSFPRIPRLIYHRAVKRGGEAYEKETADLL